jgi:hypothetical protein
MCVRCGTAGHLQRAACKVSKKKDCTHCGRTGHLEAACFQKHKPKQAAAAAQSGDAVLQGAGVSQTLGAAARQFAVASVLPVLAAGSVLGMLDSGATPRSAVGRRDLLEDYKPFAPGAAPLVQTASAADAVPLGQGTLGVLIQAPHDTHGPVHPIALPGTLYLHAAPVYAPTVRGVRVEKYPRSATVPSSRTPRRARRSCGCRARLARTRQSCC